MDPIGQSLITQWTRPACSSVGNGFLDERMNEWCQASLTLCQFCVFRSPFWWFGAAPKTESGEYASVWWYLCNTSNHTNTHKRTNIFFSIFSWVSVCSVRSSSFFSHSVDLFGVCITQIPRSTVWALSECINSLFIYDAFCYLFAFFPFSLYRLGRDARMQTKRDGSHSHSHRIDIWCEWDLGRFFVRVGLWLWVDVCIHLMYVQCAHCGCHTGIRIYDGVIWVMAAETSYAQNTKWHTF